MLGGSSLRGPQKKANDFSVRAELLIGVSMNE